MKKSLLATLIITSLGTVSNHALADLEQKPLTAKEAKQPAKVRIIEGVTSIKSKDKVTYENQNKDIEFIQSELSACAGDEICEVESVDKLINSSGRFSGKLQEISDDYIVINNKTIKPEIASQKTSFTKNLTVLKDDVSALHKRKKKLDELSKLGRNLNEDDKVTVVQLQTELQVGKAKFMSSFNQLSLTKSYIDGLDRLVGINEHRARQTKIDSVREHGKAQILEFKKGVIISALQAANFDSDVLFEVISATIPDVDLDIPHFEPNLGGSNKRFGPLTLPVSFAQGDDSQFWQNVPELIESLSE